MGAGEVYITIYKLEYYNISFVKMQHFLQKICILFLGITYDISNKS